MSEENGSEESGNPDNNGNAGTQGFDFGGAVGAVENEELRGWIENKGFDGVDKMADSYRNLERLFGADKAGRTLVVPGENATDEDRAAYYKSLGKPDTPADYTIQAPEGQDGKFVDWAKGAFHEANLSDAQAKAVVEKWNEYMGQQAEEATTGYNNRIEEDTTALKKEWGAKYDSNLGIAKQAAREFGMEAEQIDALENTLGFGGLMKMMHKIGSKIGEDTFEGGGNSNDSFGAMTPAQAQSAITELKHDAEFRKRLLGKDTAAQAKWDMLHKYAYSATP